MPIFVPGGELGAGPLLVSLSQELSLGYCTIVTDSDCADAIFIPAQKTGDPSAYSHTGAGPPLNM